MTLFSAIFRSSGTNDTDPDEFPLVPIKSSTFTSPSPSKPATVPEAKMWSSPTVAVMPFSSSEGPASVPEVEMSSSHCTTLTSCVLSVPAVVPEAEMSSSPITAPPVSTVDPVAVSEAEINISIPLSPSEGPAPDEEMAPSMDNLQSATGGLGNISTSRSPRSFDEVFVFDLDITDTEVPPISQDESPCKVRVQEVDYSHSMRESFYALRSRCRKQLSQIKTQEESLQQMHSLQRQHDSVLSSLYKDIENHRRHQESGNTELRQKARVIEDLAETIKKLQSDLSAITDRAKQQQGRVKDTADMDLLATRQADALEKLKQELRLAEMSSAEKQDELAQHLNSLAERDSFIAHQTETLEGLKQELILEKKSSSEKQDELTKQLDKLAVQRESEFLVLKEKSDRLMKQLEEQIARNATQSTVPPSASQHTPDFASPARGTDELEEIARKVHSMLAKDIPLPTAPSTSGPPPAPLPSVLIASGPPPVASPSPRKHSKLSRKVQLLKLEIASDKERTLNLEHVRHLFEVVFDVSKDEDFLLAPSPTPDQLRLFAETGSNGPDPFDLRWDFNCLPSSEWNQVVLHFLLRRLAELRKEERWTTAQKSNEYWTEAISQKFNRIRSLMSKSKPHLLHDKVIETGEQVSDRLVKAKEASLQKARRDARRISKYKRRMQVTKNASQLKTERGEQEDAEVWTFLHTIVASLGTEGMSSNESGEDDMVPVFLTRTMPWRREVKRELKIMDGYHLPGASSRGPKAAKRLKSAMPSSRSHVTDLAPQFYDTEWLNKNPHSASITEEFHWAEILTKA